MTDKRPLLLYNKDVVEGPLVPVKTPCATEVEGMEEGDELLIRVFDEDLQLHLELPLKEKEMTTHDIASAGKKRWLQACRVKSTGSRVSVFAVSTQ